MQIQAKSHMYHLDGQLKCLCGQSSHPSLKVPQCWPLQLPWHHLLIIKKWKSYKLPQVILRGKYVIYKCCQMQYVFPNGTEWTRNIAGHVLHLYYPTGKKEGRVERKSQQPFPALSIQRAHICCGQTYSRHWRWQVTWSQKHTKSIFSM